MYCFYVVFEIFFSNVKEKKGLKGSWPFPELIACIAAVDFLYVKSGKLIN